MTSKIQARACVFPLLIVAILFLFRFESPCIAQDAEPETPPWFTMKIDWKFSDEIVDLFSPPTDATVKQMRTWTDRLERPIPSNTDKWGGHDKYREWVARLRIDIADQIIAAEPDDATLSIALGMKWFPYFVLADQDKAKVPEMVAFHDELREYNKRHGVKLDRFTCNVLGTREAVARDLTEIDKKYLPLLEEILPIYDELLRDKPLGKNAEEFYEQKSGFLNELCRADPKYEENRKAFLDEMRKLLEERETEVKTFYLYYFLGPRESCDTPEGQAARRHWMERLDRKIAGAKSVEDLYHFYRLKGGELEKLYRADAATDEEMLAHVKSLESRVGKHIYSAGYLNDIHNMYLLMFWTEFGRLVKSETVTDEALKHLFTSAHRALHGGESAYGHGARALSFFIQEGDKLYEKCSKEQKAYYLKSFEELLAETEKVEKAWIAAGKSMYSETELPPLRDHLGRLKLSGTKIVLKGTTLDGKPFDSANLHGKIVLVDFWATWCGPCRREMPEIKKIYEQYRTKSFEVLGISIDEDKKKLVEYIEKEKLDWPMLHDPKSVLFKQCFGHGVPYCLLLDGDGKVVLRNARGDRLRQKLAELFPAE